MTNPWLKKNPFLSEWLSGANVVAGSARGRIASEVKRESTIAVNSAASDMFTMSTDAMAASRAPKRKKR